MTKVSIQNNLKKRVQTQKFANENLRAAISQDIADTIYKSKIYPRLISRKIFREIVGEKRLKNQEFKTIFEIRLKMAEPEPDDLAAGYPVEPYCYT